MNFNTHSFPPVRRRKKKNVILPILAIVFAVAAIAAAIGISFALNSPSSPVSGLPSETSDTANNTSNSSADTTVASDTTQSPETTKVPIVTTSTPSTDTTAERKLPSPSASQYTICVDPGHGYDDPGTSSEFLGNVTEKDIVFDIAMYLKDELQSYGYNVVMTHEDNINPPGTTGSYLFNPQKRIAYANSTFDFDYYISVHCDSYPSNQDVYGTRIYYQTLKGQNNSEISSIANYMRIGIDSALPDSKSALLMPMEGDSAYYVLKHAESFASILVETGFVSNPGDAKKMLDDTWKQNMAKGIAAGINAYLSSIN